MKIHILILLVLFSFIYTESEFGKLIFEENFDNENLNLSIWEYDLGNGVYGWGNDEQQYYRRNPENIYIKDNQLHIKAKVEKYGTNEYISAKITTKNTFHFTYGYVEAKIKFPIGKGIWPAFWMLGANIDEVDWPRCGEIDIIEVINEEQKIYNTIHWLTEDNEQASFEKNNNIINREEFHKYSLNWTKDEIIMYFDDEETFRYELKKIKNDMLEKPFYLLLDLAVGGNWPGFEIDQNAFPLEMIIDYIKIYQNQENFNYFQKKISFLR